VLVSIFRLPDELGIHASSLSASSQESFLALLSTFHLFSKAVETSNLWSTTPLSSADFAYP
jgi:hypothetical protein